MTKGRSIRLFLADGTPGGIITAEIMNWTGHVMVAPRSRLADLIKRPEAGRTGVYFLLGDDPNGGYKPMLYIGETDAVDERLRSHNQKKEFWERVCIVTSKDHNLTKAHAKYLESRLIAIATEAGRVVFDNGTSPEYALLPESDIADMEFFIEQVRIVLPVLGLDFLRERPKLAATPAHAPTSDEAAVRESPLFELASKKHGVHAEAREVEGEFIILAGSIARGDGSESWNSYRAQREELKQDGTLVPQNGNYVFSKDASFRSPSAASAAVLDRNDNGRTSWCIKGTRKTYADWQEEQVAAATPTGGEE